MIIPINLKESREIKGLKSKEVSELLNVKKSTVSGYENGYDTIPIKKLIIYANYTKFSLDFLFGLTKLKYRIKEIVINQNVVSSNLKKLRKEHNYTQKQISEKLNIAQSTYSNYENGVNMIPTTYLYALSKIYKPFSIDSLFDNK